MIYLDFAATTPVDSRVLDAMTPHFRENFGNPSSIHRYGQKAEDAVEDSRERVAQVLHCSAAEVIFTSCGTESDNLALRGAALAARKRSGGTRILTARTEHHAVSRTADQLQKEFGFEVDWLAVDSAGQIQAGLLERQIGEGALLASVMYANNEIGTINPIHELAATARSRGVLFHTDAVQAAAYLDVDATRLGVDLMSLGGHKFHGPKGVGALFVRQGTPLLPVLTGGGQELNRRAGTQNVPYIVGFARALELAAAERAERTRWVSPLREEIVARVLDGIPDAALTGHAVERLPNHASFVFKDVDGNLLLQLLDSAGFACSSGSACRTGSPEPSEVLLALGLTREWALGSLRVTLGRQTTEADVAAFLQVLPRLVEKARSLRRS